MAKFSSDELFAALSELTCTVSLGKRTGEPVVMRESIADFPVNAIVHMVRYGFQRGINDPVGGKDVSLDEKVKGATELIKRWKNGEVGRVRTEHESADPVRDEARNLAKTWLRKNARAAWDKMVAESKERADKEKVNVGSLINARIDGFVEKNDEKLGFTEAAKKIVEASRLEAAEIEIDL